MEDLLNRITTDPNMCFGKPCIRGMRYPVVFVLEWMSSGMTNEEILEDYPGLEPDDLRAAVAYAAKFMQDHRQVASA